MDSITVPRSVFVNGQWATAHWMADVVDESTGELVITATLADVGDRGPVVTALRMDMALAQQLRAMAGFFKGEQLELDGSGGSDCYDCRTTGERLAVQEDRLQILSDTMRRIVAEIDQRLYGEEKATALHNQRLNAVTKRVDTLEDGHNRLVLFAGSDKEIKDLHDRLTALETTAVDKMPAFDRWQARQDGEMAELTDRLSELESAMRLNDRVMHTTFNQNESRLDALEPLNLGTRVAYLERTLEGRTGPEAGL